MYGLEFHKADNAMICGSAEFEVRKVGRQGQSESGYYKIVFGPDGMWLSKPALNGTEEWTTITERAEVADIEAILPKRSDYGLDWTYSQFMLALTFYGEGHKRGYTQGKWKGRELERNRIKYEQVHAEARQETDK